MTTPTGSQALLLRLLRPSTRANPYPVYHELRKRGTLHIPWANLTVFSSFRDCDDVLRHPATATGIMFARREIDAGAQLRSFGKRAFCFSTRRTTPGCASSSARRSCLRWSRRSRRTSRAGRRAAGPYRRGRGHVRRDRGPGLSAAGGGDLPAAGRAARGRAGSSAGPLRCWRGRWIRSSPFTGDGGGDPMERRPPAGGCAIPPRPDRPAPPCARRRPDSA